MPRQARLDAPGTLHHVITRGIEKKRIVKGHAGIDWQDLDYVLRWFGKREGEAKRAYAQQIATILLGEYGVPMAEIARQVGDTTSAISKMLLRSKSN